MPIAINNLLANLRGPNSMARGLGAPLLLMIVLAMIVVPLAPFVLDLLFTFTTNGTTTAFSSFTETVSQSVGRTLTINTVSADNMVFINEAIPLTGTAAAGARVSLNINGTTRTTTADVDGNWSYDMKLVPLVRYIMVRDVLDGTGGYSSTGVFDISELKAKQGSNDLAAAKPVYVSWRGATVTSLTDSNSGSYEEVGGTGLVGARDRRLVDARSHLRQHQRQSGGCSFRQRLHRRWHRPVVERKTDRQQWIPVLPIRQRQDIYGHP